MLHSYFHINFFNINSLHIFMKCNWCAEGCISLCMLSYSLAQQCHPHFYSHADKNISV